MKRIIGTIITVLILSGLSLGLSSFITNHTNTQLTKQIPTDTPLPPLPDYFSDMPLPETATVTTAPTQSENRILYTLDRYYNVVPLNNSDNKKVVLLTIDDGPLNSKTLDSILTTLKEYDIHALFFVVGNKASVNKELLKKIIDDGHTVGNHTWSHSDMKKMSLATAKSEITRANTFLAPYLPNNSVRFFRPPYGNYTDAIKTYAQEQGLLFMTWSLGGEDWLKKYQSPEALTSHVLSGVAPGSNILLHEHRWTSEALPGIIQGLLEKGYTIIDPNDIISAQE